MLPREKFCGFFSQVLLIHFEWKIGHNDGQNQDHVFPNRGTFFDFQKKAGVACPPPPLVVHLLLVFWSFQSKLVKKSRKSYPIFVKLLIFNRSASSNEIIIDYLLILAKGNTKTMSGFFFNKQINYFDSIIHCQQ